MTEESIVFVLLLVLPLIVCYALLKKHWVDVELQRAFLAGLAMGIPAVILTRIAYMPVESYLGSDLRSFISAPGDWKTTLATCILVIGFIEELLKVAAGSVATFYVAYLKRSTVLFLAFCGCALSFSLIENVQYFLIFGSGVVLPRILISSTAHVAFTAIAASLAISGLHSKRPDSVLAVRILLGVLLAAIAHGFFDFLVFHFDVNAMSGLIVALVGSFILVIYESWIYALKYDVEPEAGLTICTGCGAFSIDKRRFCGFCGHRVILNRHEVSFRQ